MAPSVIPVDLRNPGQVFACLGLMEAADAVIGPAEGGFRWRAASMQAAFAMEVAGADDPVATVLRFLARAEAVALAPAGSDLADDHGAATRPAGDGAFPCMPPRTGSSLPILLQDAQASLPIFHWADHKTAGRDNVKFWGGNTSGAAIAGALLTSLRGKAPLDVPAAAADPFNLARPQSSSFRLDWRRDYIALDIGFSPNDHGDIRMVGYPLVELLAAIGLQNARPVRPSRADRLTYRYGAWGTPLPTLLARAALGAQPMGFPVRTFTMTLGWPNQEGQARCIKDAQEDHRDA